MSLVSLVNTHGCLPFPSAIRIYRSPIIFPGRTLCRNNDSIPKVNGRNVLHLKDQGKTTKYEMSHALILQFLENKIEFVKYLLFEDDMFDFPPIINVSVIGLGWSMLLP